ncbi:MAG: ferric reductase-like transmembrane domain-containing protein [Elusimicrobia bacterium]|nr:ferric reductase-like transmembrane domain-containing protein [Elusimicrobiota bacterium]
MFSRRNIGSAALAILGFLPLAIAAGTGSLGPFDSAAAWLGGLGRAAGILGLSFFLLAAIISVRLPGVDAHFGGLTRLWNIHHALGAASFLLLMGHPLLLAFAAAGASPRAAAAVLFPGPGEWSVWAGWAALAVMTAFLAPTFSFFGAPDYQRWKSLHALSGAALVLGVAHALPLGRSLPGRWGAAIWAGGGALALLSFAYRMAIARFVGRKSYRVCRVDAIGRGVVELSLKPDGELLAYRPGQFVYLTPLDDGLARGRGEEHPYTVSSSPREPVLRIAIKDLGDATHALQTAAVGSRALVEGPYGGIFPPGEKEARELWIAGGIGLTPFLGRVRGLSADRPADIHLIYCVQDETRAHFLQELEGAAAKVPGFKLTMHFFAREGPLNAAFLRSRCPDLRGRDVYVCGPIPLIDGARRELRGAGVPASRIHSEDLAWL